MIPAQQVRRPLVGAVLSAAAGLAAQRAWPIPPLLLLSLAAFMLARICFRRNTPSLYLACGLLAAAHGALERGSDSLRTALLQAEVFSSAQVVTGTVTDDPVYTGEQVSFRMQAESVLLDGCRTVDRSVLRVYLKNPPEPAAYGERWQIKGTVTGYTQSRGGTDATMIASGADAQRIRPSGFSLTGYCYTLRNRASTVLSSGIENFPTEESLLHALLLGYRQAIPRALYETFSRTGTLHIFAISGLHVGVMASIFIAALKIAGVCRLRWGWVLVPALFFYVLATGMKPSALRAFTMAAVYFAAPLAGRRPDAPSAIALAAFILLAHRPGYIAEPGFLLSFVVVCGLIMVHGRAGQHLSGLCTAGREFSLGSHPAGSLLRGTGLLMLTSLAAWLFSAPVTACFFNTLAPAALIGNLAVIPLTFMIVLTACLALLSGVLCFPAAIILFNQANLLFIGLLIRIIPLLALLPGACLTVLAPSATATGLWYTGLVLLFTGPVRWRKAGALTFLLACILWTTEHRFRHEEIVIFREDRSAVAVRLPGLNPGWVLATDGNPFYAERTIRRLQKAGINRLHTLTVTRPEAGDETIRRFEKIFRPLFVEPASAETATDARGRPAGVEIFKPSRTGPLTFRTL